MKSFTLINTQHTLVSFQYLRSPSAGELHERPCMVFSSLCLAHFSLSSCSRPQVQREF